MIGYSVAVSNDREVLENAVSRLQRAIERGTGTSLDADEVRVFGILLHATASAALGSATGREACAVCGRPEHRPAAVGGYAKHVYERALLVPLTG